jgi:hypothetical protein
MTSRPCYAATVVALFTAIGCSGVRPQPQIDQAALLARADLHYSQPVGRSEAGIPIGNGRMGTLLWTTPTALHAQINRVDVFGQDRDTTSFPEKHTDYCGGCAFVDIDVGGDAFIGKSFAQHLYVADGLTTATGDGVAIRGLALSDKDVMAFEVTDDRAQPQPITVRLRMLRPPIEKRFNHTAESSLGSTLNPGNGGQSTTITLTQRFTEADYYCSSAVAADVVGGRGGDIVARPDERTIQLSLPAAQGKLIVRISSAATMAANQDPTPAAMALLAGQSPQDQSFDAMLASNKRWWSEFWSKSRLHLHSADGVADRVEANFNYYLYLMACTSRGKYPTKFNGMLWITGGDKRQWGTQYWGANQSCLYNTALLAANHAELEDCMFDMYRDMLPSLEQAAREQWDSQGAFIPETGAFDGLAPLPPDIAAEMRDLYLMRKPWSQRSQRFVDYAAVRMGYSSRWNFISTGRWEDDQYIVNIRSDSPFGPVTHTFARGAKIAYEYWNRYQFTDDENFLRDKAYPVIRDAAEMYRHFPNLVKESDGLYHIHHVNDNEGLWDGSDTGEEISGMRGIFPTAIAASKILGVDAADRAAWREILEHLAPLPRSDSPLVKSNRKIPVWIRAISSEGFRHPTLGLPDGNTMPEWFFDLCTLDAPAEMRRIANNTFDAFSARSPDAARLATQSTTEAATQPTTQRRRGGGGGVSVLSKLPIAAAKLGRVDDVKRLLPAQSFQGESPVLDNRMDLREGPQTTSAQRLGNAADALQTAVCQSLPGEPAGPFALRVFPAWPREWDAEFTFLERGGFIVTGSIHNGQIDPIQIVSQHGGELRVHNPWPGVSVEIRSSTGIIDRTGDVMSLQTRVGETIMLTPRL